MTIFKKLISRTGPHSPRSKVDHLTVRRLAVGGRPFSLIFTNRKYLFRSKALTPAYRSRAHSNRSSDYTSVFITQIIIL